MKIKSIKILDVGGIPSIEIDGLNSQMNIICGVNGIGKTGILNVLAFAFSDHDKYSIKKRYGSINGEIDILYSNNEMEDRYYNKVNVFQPEFYASQLYEDSFVARKLPSENAIYLKVNRVFDYKYEDAIKRDPLYDLYGKDVTQGVLQDDLKSWFISRDLFDGKNYLHEYQKYNLNLAKSFISSLSNGYSFSRVDTDHELMINTESGEIYFEYLSSGFKSAFFILLGILMDMEYKHGKNYIKADEYSGIILIDEIELHLHPEWQSKIIKILKQEFPKAQFFITTHSPHIIQSAEYNEIIALDKRETSDQKVPFEIYQRELSGSAEYGFQGWTVEEILTDVMGMKTTSGAAYDCQMAKFNQALENGDKRSAEEAYSELSKMLHPDNHMKKMLQLEMIGLE